MSAHRERLSSIRLKAVGVVFALTAVLVAFLTTYFPARHIQSVRRQLCDKAMTYARLVAKQVEPGVAFDDRETVREVFTATAEDQDVRALALYDARGRMLFSLGEFTSGDGAPNHRPETVLISGGDSFVRATAPVVSREGPTGILILEVDGARAEAERAAIQRTSLLVGLGALALGFVAAWVIGRSIGRRLGRIADATRAVAGGDLDVRPLEDASSDEIGQLARSFNGMFENIRTLLERIREANARETERLDGLVKARTRELDERNRDMRLVLDNVSQGLLLVDRSGTMGKERSAVVSRWFGEAGPQVTFWDYLERFDPRAAFAFRLNWEAVLEEVMPVELSIYQLPRTLQASERAYEVEYTPLFDEGHLAQMLVVVSDVTERRAAERAESEQREVVCAFGHVMRDRTGFLEFFDEAGSLVDRITDDRRPAPGDVRRWLHTLKGNASLFGLTAFGALCHSLEDATAETRADLTAEHRRALSAHWRTFAGRFSALLGDRAHGSVEVNQAEYEALLQALFEGHPRKDIAAMVAGWKLEPVSERFAKFGIQARALAQRLGKVPVEVEIEADGVRLSRPTMASFWSAFAHAVRNAVDHGLEKPEERAEASKPSVGVLRMRASNSNGEIAIEISDDGRGIDWQKVSAKARAAGLPSLSQADLVAALFADGLSTRDEVDAVSGRGVGMGALRAECDKLGGRMGVVSRAGRGTTMQFVFDANVVGEPEETRSAQWTVPQPGARSHAPVNSPIQRPA